MRTLIFLVLISVGAHTAEPKFEDLALTMVPRGTILEKKPTEYVVKSGAGTKVKVEFERSGKLQEASGQNLNKGDDFEPGMGLLSLSSAARKAMDDKFRFLGGWSLEKDPTLGWVYEFHIEKNAEPEYLVISAKSGRNISSASALPRDPSRRGTPSQKHQKATSP